MTTLVTKRTTVSMVTKITGIPVGYCVCQCSYNAAEVFRFVGIF